MLLRLDASRAEQTRYSSSRQLKAGGQSTNTTEMGVDGVEAQKRQRKQVDAEGEISSRNQAPAKSAQTKVVQIDKAAKWEAAESNENSTYESGVPEELAVLVKTIRDSSVGSEVKSACEKLRRIVQDEQNGNGLIASKGPWSETAMLMVAEADTALVSKVSSGEVIDVECCLALAALLDSASNLRNKLRMPPGAPDALTAALNRGVSSVNDQVCGCICLCIAAYAFGGAESQSKLIDAGAHKAIIRAVNFLPNLDDIKARTLADVTAYALAAFLVAVEDAGNFAAYGNLAAAAAVGADIEARRRQRCAPPPRAGLVKVVRRLR